MKGASVAWGRTRIASISPSDCLADSSHLGDVGFARAFAATGAQYPAQDARSVGVWSDDAEFEE